MSDQALSEVTVTVKASAKHDASWLVFRGPVNQVRADIVSTFQLDESAYSFSLAELTVVATDAFQGINSAKSALGGKLVAPAEAAPAQAVEQKPPWNDDGVPAPTPGDPWADVDAGGAQSAPVEAPAAPPADPLLEAIKASTSLDQIQRLWADHQDRFNSPDVQAAVNARRAEAGF